MTAHIGVGEFFSPVHYLKCGATNVGDVTATHERLRGKKDYVQGHSGYTDTDARVELRDCKATILIAKKRGKLKAIKNTRDRLQHERWGGWKASALANLERLFRIIKRQLSFTTMRYRGLAKNRLQVLTLFALPNLWMTRRQLLPAQG